MKKILVSGANGFLGKNTLPFLLEAGYEVHAVSTGTHDSRAVTWHRLDLFDAPAVRRLLDEVRPEALLHLAWITTPGEYLESPENLTWVAASLNLCRAFYENGGRRAVFSGTCFEYDLRRPGPFREDAPCSPSSLYGRCKLSLGEIIKDYCTARHLSYAWGRLFYLFGPYERESRVVPYVITSVLRGAPALCTAGNAKRDYLYAEDAARAFVHLVGTQSDGVFNIGSGKAVPLKRLLRLAAVGARGPRLLRLGAVPSREGETPEIAADVGKLSATGFSPMSGLDAGMCKTVEYWKGRQHSFLEEGEKESECKQGLFPAGQEAAAHAGND